MKILPILMFFLMISPVIALTNITNCTNLNQTGETYNLINNIIYNESEINCFRITSDDIILNCQNYNISSLQSGKYFINNYGNNVSIKNCNIYNFSGSNGAINIESENNNIFNNYIYNDDGNRALGINFDNNNIFNNTIIGYFSNILLKLSDGNNVNIHDNYFKNLGNGDNYLIYISSMSNLSIYNNKFYSGYNDYTIGFNIYADIQNVTIYNNLFNSTNYLNDNSTGQLLFNTTKQIGNRIYSNGVLIGGNYYVGYSENCNDTNKNGFCDLPFNLYSKNTNCTEYICDYLPLSDKYQKYTKIFIYSITPLKNNATLNITIDPFYNISQSVNIKFNNISIANETINTTKSFKYNINVTKNNNLNLSSLYPLENTTSTFINYAYKEKNTNISFIHKFIIDLIIIIILLGMIGLFGISIYFGIEQQNYLLSIVFFILCIIVVIIGLQFIPNIFLNYEVFYTIINGILQ